MTDCRGERVALALTREELGRLGLRDELGKGEVDMWDLMDVIERYRALSGTFVTLTYTEHADDGLVALADFLTFAYDLSEHLRGERRIATPCVMARERSKRGGLHMHALFLGVSEECMDADWLGRSWLKGHARAQAVDAVGMRYSGLYLLRRHALLADESGRNARVRVIYRRVCDDVE